MATLFPHHSELGQLQSIHEVKWTAHPVRLLPGVFGLLSFGGGFAAMDESSAKVLGIIAMFAFSIALVALSYWLVRRRLARGPACAVYDQGIAVRQRDHVYYLRWGTFSVTRVMLRGIGSSLLSVRITGTGNADAELHVDQIQRVKHLLAALEPHFR